MRSVILSRRRLRNALAVLGVAAACTALHAQPALPPMQGQGAYRYACGGIGFDESTVMRAAMRLHPLSLLFAESGGEYLANVQVTIRDASGAELLALTAGGPVCLFDLPPGRYSVQASHGGVFRSQDVSVGGEPRRVAFRF